MYHNVQRHKTSNDGIINLIQQNFERSKSITKKNLRNSSNTVVNKNPRMCVKVNTEYSQIKITSLVKPENSLTVSNTPKLSNSVLFESRNPGFNNTSSSTSCFLNQNLSVNFNKPVLNSSYETRHG